jgi:type I restriction enzyme, S subunit
MRNLSQAALSKIVLPWPEEEERQEIVRRIETAFAWLDRVAVEHDNASRLLPKLDQAILAKAFRGELVLPERSVGELVHDFGGGTNG